MSIAQGCVKEDVSQARPPDVLWLICHIREDYPAGVHTLGGSFCMDSGLPEKGEPEKPQHRVGHPLENITPGSEGLWVILIQLVGARIHNLVCRQAYV